MFDFDVVTGANPQPVRAPAPGPSEPKAPARPAERGGDQGKPPERN